MTKIDSFAEQFREITKTTQNVFRFFFLSFVGDVFFILFCISIYSNIIILLHPICTHTHLSLSLFLSHTHKHIFLTHKSVSLSNTHSLLHKLSHTYTHSHTLTHTHTHSHTLTHTHTHSPTFPHSYIHIHSHISHFPPSLACACLNVPEAISLWLSAWLKRQSLLQMFPKCWLGFR